MPNHEDQYHLRNRVLLFISLCIGYALFIAFMMAATPVEARGPDGAQWTVDFDFSKGSVDALLTIEIGSVVNGKLTNPSVHKVPIYCAEQNGALTPVAEGVEFDGTVYIKCDLPNISAIVYKITRGELVLAASCEAKNPWIEADLWVDPDQDTELGSPVFYHPDLQLNTAVTNNQQDVSLRFRVDEGQATSNHFPLPGAVVNALATMKYDPDESLYRAGFFFDNQSSVGYGTGLNQSLLISTLDEEIYVGYEPSGTTFKGIISKLTIDPPCIGGSI